MKRALDEVNGRISTIGGLGGIPLQRLADLGISRVSFGPQTMGLALAALQRAATTLTALGDYPEDLRFTFSL